jgi:hypothetical protein
MYIQIYLSIYISIYIYMQLSQTENGSPGDFPWSVYHLLIVQTEVCRLSVCLWRNKQKLSVCKGTKRTKWICPSVCILVQIWADTDCTGLCHPALTRYSASLALPPPALLSFPAWSHILECPLYSIICIYFISSFLLRTTYKDRWGKTMLKSLACEAEPCLRSALKKTRCTNYFNGVPTVNRCREALKKQ